MRFNRILPLLLLFIHLLSFAEVSIKISDDNITPADPVRLIITLTGDDIHSQPANTKELEKDFEIVNRSQSQSISIINGHTERQNQWIYTLLPKRAGTLKIPSLQFRKNTTQSHLITVSQSSAEPQKSHAPQTAPQKNQAPTVFLEVDLKQKQAYIHSQIKYRVRLFYAENIMNGTLTDPSAAHANILRLPQDKNYQKQFKGRLYQVLERDYAIFPEKSGSLKITGPAFTGLRSQLTNRFQQFDPFFSNTKAPVRLFGDVKTMNIKPIPENIQPNEWLPATRVELTDQWQMPKKMEVGQPIQRLATLKVYGSTQAQLPDLNTIQADGIKVYADEPSTQNLSESDHILAEKTQKFTYIPSKTGDFTLPPTIIKWWNIETNQVETTRLEGKTVHITGVANEQAGTNNTSALNSSQKAEQLPLLSTRKSQSNFGFNSILALFFFGLWVVTLLLWKYQSRTGVKNPLKTSKRAFKKLIHACEGENPKLIEQRLLEWAETMWSNPTPRNLMEVSMRVNQINLRTEIKFLESAIYGNNPHWTADSLKEALIKYKTYHKQNAAKPDELPGLYQDFKK